MSDYYSWLVFNEYFWDGGLTCYLREYWQKQYPFAWASGALKRITNGNY
jgi:hypothetical protein